MRIERITAQAVNRGIHEAHSQVRRLCSNDLSNSYTARESQFLYFVFIQFIES